MKYFLILLTSLFFIPSNSIENTSSNQNYFVVVQLFTSKFCPYCSEADELIAKINQEYKEKKVYVLSYHVDYWDRGDRKDPFGKKSFTELQYAYAKQFKERRVYTPQVVLNGKDHFNGTIESRLRKKIKNYLKKESQNIIKLSYNKNEKGNLALNYEISGEMIDKNLKLAFVLKTKKALANTNIVLEEMIVELKNNKGSILIPTITSEVKKDLLVIGYVQNKKLQITGATQFEF